MQEKIFSNIAKLIPVYPQKVNLETLSLITGHEDRTVRILIMKARINGEMICNEQDGSGYYMTNDPVLLRRQIAQMKSRAGSLFKQINELEKNIKAIESLEDYEQTLLQDK